MTLFQLKKRTYLGFGDELINDKNLGLLDFTSNKVGGLPNCFDGKIFSNPSCSLCGLTLPLIIQVYVPLDNSPFHRTLYIFGCVNPLCWNKTESWVCLRSQLLEDNTIKKHQERPSSFDWCENATAWDDEELNNDSDSITKEKELIGDLSEDSELLSKTSRNMPSCSGKTMPYLLIDKPSAEIEEDEANTVIADVPCKPQVDLPTLLNQVKPFPEINQNNLQFVSFFIYVIEEQYKVLNSDDNFEIKENACVNMADNKDELEGYEKTIPVHGDKLFHQFISRIQKNPGQILRYIREGGEPLFLYEPEDLPNKCQHCKGELEIELQLLPTLISHLDLIDSGFGHIEFGTVFILSCKNSCWSPEDTIRSEYVLVQSEI